MRYIVTGCTLINDLIYADGSRAEGLLGGAIYAANGVKPYTDDLMFVTTVGPDFEGLFGQYYRDNGLSTAGIESVLPKTQYNMLEYEPDGRWSEYSKYGPDFSAKWGYTALIKPEFILKHAGPTTLGIYLESGVGEPVWDGLSHIREAAPLAKVMWEVPGWEIDDPEKRPGLDRLLELSDIFSINLPESLALFGASGEEEVIELIKKLGKPCFFRVGKRGSYMIQDGEAWFAPSVGLGESVDSTGCGNCSTGAAMYGFCEGRHPLETAYLANYAAYVNALQVGPYPRYTPELRDRLLLSVKESLRAAGI